MCMFNGQLSRVRERAREAEGQWQAKKKKKKEKKEKKKKKKKRRADRNGPVVGDFSGEQAKKYGERCHMSRAMADNADEKKIRIR